MERIYIAIDLKSFYASVECVERGLSPLDTNLVVADASRTEKTICLAVSPALKSIGIPGRPRLFEVVAKTAEENRRRAKDRKSFFGRKLLGGRAEEKSAAEAFVYCRTAENAAVYKVQHGYLCWLS